MHKRPSPPGRPPPPDHDPATTVQTPTQPGPAVTASSHDPSTPLDQLAARAWRALLALAHAPGTQLDPTLAALLQPDARDGWRAADGLPAALRDFLDLYLPFCRRTDQAPLLVAHLGQSLDGCIATGAGDSCFVTGPANITHLHRMRALADAVLVGAGTVAHDDPRLTTRLVPGPCPVRVVLDPRGRLGPRQRLFTDRAAPTLLVRAGNAGARRPAWSPPTPAGATAAAVEIIHTPLTDAGAIDLPSLLTCLQARGLERVFIEGGGVTVSAFLAQGLLARLQIAVAPLVIGQGRPGVSLPPAAELARALRPASRIYRMGEDMLYDLDLGADPARGSADPGQLPVRVR